MELKVFVAETIQSIIEGVKNAQELAEDSGALINPGNLQLRIGEQANNTLYDQSNNVCAQSISFDVAITVEEKAGEKGTIKILGGILNAEAGGNSNLTNSIANRVQFVVPVMLPVQNTDNPEARSKVTVELLE